MPNDRRLLYENPLASDGCVGSSPTRGTKRTKEKCLQVLLVRRFLFWTFASSAQDLRRKSHSRYKKQEGDLNGLFFLIYARERRAIFMLKHTKVAKTRAI